MPELMSFRSGFLPEEKSENWCKGFSLVIRFIQRGLERNLLILSVVLDSAFAVEQLLVTATQNGVGEEIMRYKISLLILGILIFCTFFGVSAVQDDAALKAAKKDHEKECARCHGDEGKGDGATSRMLKVKPADWTDSNRMAGLSDEQLYLIIEKGGEGVGKSKLMPAFGSKLSKEQITRLVAFVKSFHD